MRFQSAATLFMILLSSQPIFAQSFSMTGKMGQSAATIESNRKHKSAIDFAISPSGEFRGVVADRDGKPCADFDVLLLTKTKLVGATRTDKDGRFAFTNVAPGPKVLRTAESSQNIRLWPTDIAPPNAKSGILLVHGDSTVRAQHCSSGPSCAGCDSCRESDLAALVGGNLQRILLNPWLVGAGTAAAIAIPLATDDDDKRDNDFTNEIQISEDTVVADGDGGAGEPAS